ncbi:MAG: translation initiation inhibitor [Planctomycetes bacterium]|nr:translation initiation inhibitor [Planctomycetota bacterium]
MQQSSKESASVKIVSTDGMDVASLSRACCSKHFITSHASSDPFEMFARLGEYVRANKVAIFQQYVFGGCQHYDSGMKAIEKACGEIKWPITWLQGDGCNGEDLTATQAYAITGDCYKPIVFEGKVAGAVYEDEHARYCLIGDLLPDDVTVSREKQTRNVFEKMNRILKTVGMDFLNVVRTWMYLEKLLEWYDEFNTVRTTFFEELGVFDNLVPASTGIGVANPAGAALVTDLFAVKPKTGHVKISEVESPLQCSATDYRSSFSRAIEVALPDHRTIYVSGTASIEPSGKTIHIDDVKKQIGLTMEVAEAILKGRDMGWEDTVRAIAYFKDIKDVPLFTKYCKDRNLPKMPFALSHSDVCRDDLLFEIELDAIKKSNPNSVHPARNIKALPVCKPAKRAIKDKTLGQ